MNRTAERTLNQELAWRLNPYPLIDIPVPNDFWLHADTPEEKKLVAKIITRMKKEGRLLIGAPDRVLVWRGGGALIELKRKRHVDFLGKVLPAGKPTDEQAHLAARAQRLGINHSYIHSWDELQAAIELWGIKR
jgi:hypothetical protein